MLSLDTEGYKRLLRAKHYPDLRNVAVRPHETAALAERLLGRGDDLPDAITRKVPRRLPSPALSPPSALFFFF